jgi:hypothetical protein
MIQTEDIKQNVKKFKELIVYSTKENEINKIIFSNQRS